MPRKKSPPQPTDLPLRQFTLDFFRFFGATVHETENQAVDVALPAELAEHFGKPALSLVFSTAELSPYHDLVAYGSRVFDRIVNYVANHGSLAREILPNQFPERATKNLPPEISLTRCTLTNVRGKTGWSYVTQFNFHLSYRADDKREEIFSVALDENGQVVENMASLLAEATPAGTEVEPPHETVLSELTTQAQKLAEFHADQQCASFEQEILPRLHKTLSRLVTYYEQQALEIQERGDDPDYASSQRDALRADLQRKIAEEVELHRLRVAVTLFSLAQVAQPTWETQLALRSEHGDATLKLPLTRNLYTGELAWPVCHACDKATNVVGVCTHEHATCETCLKTCHACARDVCLECGVQNCSVCREMLCADCAVTCPACAQWACTEHAARCPTCQQTTCFSCQSTCAQCGVRQCTNHLTADSLAPDALLCATCAVTCPSCQRVTAQTETCDFCGQVFCRGCVDTCYACGKTFCKAHLLADAINGGAVCKRCAEPCPRCGQETASLATCTTCHVEQCTSCLRACTECGTMRCVDHRTACELCHQIFCDVHSDSCYVDGKIVCVQHSFSCPVCDKTVCHMHQKFCTACGVAYCLHCVDEVSNLCNTCQQLEEAELVNLAQEPVGHDPDVAALAHGYAWRAASNRRYTIYLGTRLLQQMMIVATKEGHVVRTSHLKGIEALLKWGRSLLN